MLLQFKVKLTSVMIADFIGCWLIEVICKKLFADLAPKAIVTRGRERREARRAAELKEHLEKERIEREKKEAEALLEYEKEQAKNESRKNR
jgi:cation-transporting ATPase 13A1